MVDVTARYAGNITKIEVRERDGDYGKQRDGSYGYDGEGGRIAEVIFTYADGTTKTLRAESCECCGGAQWMREDTGE